MFSGQRVQWVTKVPGITDTSRLDRTYEGTEKFGKEDNTKTLRVQWYSITRILGVVKTHNIKMRFPLFDRGLL